MSGAENQRPRSRNQQPAIAPLHLKCCRISDAGQFVQSIRVQWLAANLALGLQTFE